jgi:hypothetical protein
MKRDQMGRLGLFFTIVSLVALLSQVSLPARAAEESAAGYRAFLPLVMGNHPPVSSIFGVRMQRVTVGFGLPEAIEAEVHVVNSVTFSWKGIEPTNTSPSNFRWWMVDETSLINAADNGLEIVGDIHETPDWAQARPGYSCGPIAAEHLDDFAQFLQAVVSRYGVHPYHVRFWKIWNEPDADYRLVEPDSGYGCWGDADAADYGGSVYAQMLKVAYPAIKAAAPEATVLVGGLLLNDATSSASKFMEGILQGGGGPYFDVLDYHAYTYYLGLGKIGNSNWPGSTTAIPEKAEFLRSVLDEYGYSEKPLMVTEAAMLASTDNPTQNFLETQAMYVPQAYAEGLALGLKGVIYFSMTDDWENRSNGLLRDDLSKKPSYYAYQAATSFLSQAYYKAPATGYPDGVEGYAFAQLNAQEVDVVWSVDGTSRTVHLPADASAFDRYGASLGSGTIEVGYSPVYVVRP